MQISFDLNNIMSEIENIPWIYIIWKSFCVLCPQQQSETAPGLVSHDVILSPNLHVFRKEKSHQQPRCSGT